MSGIIRKSVFLTVLSLLFGCLFNIGLISGGSLAQAEELRCGVCGKSVNGVYYSVKGRVLCERDYKASLPKCAKCGQIISGKYWQLDGGKYVCEKDYIASLPRCAVCGQKLTGTYYQNERGQKLCERDHKASCPVCSACGKKIIKGGYSKLERDNLVACAACMARGGPECFLCSLPVIKNGVKYSDGRYACKYHCSGAITTQKQLNPYLRRAWKLIAAYVSPKFRVSPEYLTLHIVDENSLKEHHAPTDDISTVFGLTRTFMRGGSMIFQIWILQGLLPDDLDSTMVHECGHVWFSVNNKKAKNGESAKEEGFCQWLSYKVNLGLGRRWQAEHIDRRTDPIYGKGFQRYKAIEKQSGIRGVMRYALSDK